MYIQPSQQRRAVPYSWHRAQVILLNAVRSGSLDKWPTHSFASYALHHSPCWPLWRLLASTEAFFHWVLSTESKNFSSQQIMSASSSAEFGLQIHWGSSCIFWVKARIRLSLSHHWEILGRVSRKIFKEKQVRSPTLAVPLEKACIVTSARVQQFDPAIDLMFLRSIHALWLRYTPVQERLT